VKLQILRFDAHLLNMRTRMPFRFGISTMTAAPHLFLRVELAVDGQRISGVAADHLPPKWFTKNPATRFADDIAEMLRIIQHAAHQATLLPPADTPFSLWKQLYAAQSVLIERENLPPLLGFFGVSLVERAMLDAFCRAVQLPFAQVLRRNLLGIEGMRLDLLSLPSPRPPESVIVRHTVGLTDPITTEDIGPEERLADGLPQSLDQCIAAYGLTHFKIKLCGDAAKDLDRLRRLAALLDEQCPDYAFTLDGNENFFALAPFRALWQSLNADDSLHPFLGKLIFIEQPLHRDVALSEGVKQEMLAWRNRPPLIVDESDAALASLPAAIECGYIGASHKNCKGIFKGIRNACLIAELRHARPETHWILSGEDLSNVGPVALLQDLAVMANLGITHVERNGHHYFRGLSYLPPELQTTILKHHRDLYRPHERGFATLDVRGGRISTASAIAAPFGMGFEFDPSQFTPVERWAFEAV
jgi:L-alanine-DL-glutamate epimerase-like enolase superfamily enzyme